MNTEKIIMSAFKTKKEFECPKDLQKVWKHRSLWKTEKPEPDDIYKLRTGRHHAEIIHMFHEQIDQSTDGFYTSYGRWVDRKTAAMIAVENGQCAKPLIMGDRLDSSDIF